MNRPLHPAGNALASPDQGGRVSPARVGEMDSRSSAGMLQKAAQLCAEGVAFALVTVVRAVAPTSGKPGDKAILTERGEWLGWVGGSCAEPAARRAALAALEDGECRLLHITADGSEPARPGVEQS